MFLFKIDLFDPAATFFVSLISCESPSTNILKSLKLSPAPSCSRLLLPPLLMYSFSSQEGERKGKMAIIKHHLCLRSPQLQMLIGDTAIQPCPITPSSRSLD